MSRPDLKKYVADPWFGGDVGGHVHDEGVGAGVDWLAVVEYVDDHMLRVDRAVNAMVDYLLCILKLVLGGFSVYTDTSEGSLCQAWPMK